MFFSQQRKLLIVYCGILEDNNVHYLWKIVYYEYVDVSQSERKLLRKGIAFILKNEPNNVLSPNELICEKDDPTFCKTSGWAFFQLENIHCCSVNSLANRKPFYNLLSIKDTDFELSIKDTYFEILNYEADIERNNWTNNFGRQPTDFSELVYSLKVPSEPQAENNELPKSLHAFLGERNDAGMESKDSTNVNEETSGTGVEQGNKNKTD